MTFFIIITVIFIGKYFLNPQQAVILTAIRFLIFYFILFFIFEIINRYFIYEIFIDTKLKKITFFLFKKRKTITLNSKEIEKIYVNFYVSFIFSGERLFFKDTTNQELIKWIKRQQNSKFGWFHNWDKKNS